MTGKQARRRQLLRTIGLRFSGMDVLKALGLYLVAVIIVCCFSLSLFLPFDMHNDTSYVAMIFLLDVFPYRLLDGRLSAGHHHGSGGDVQRGHHLYLPLLAYQLYADGLSADVPGDDDHLHPDRHRYQPGQADRAGAPGGRPRKRCMPTCCAPCLTTSARR